ncbi:MAG: response regulator [Gammaproteobacteria bacterium]|nr:response regulator [Gammaproteobacteria bacterium]
MKKYQILLVEDDKTVQHITTMLFEQQACEIIIAATAKEAKLLANTQPFSLIIMDIGLPDDDGWDIIKHIRENLNCRNQKTPIVVVTAHYHGKQQQMECDSYQIWQIIEKPLLPHQITEIITRLEPYGHLKVYDEEQAIALNQDAATAKQMLQLFAGQLNQAAPQLDYYFNAKDWARLRKAIHKENGASLYAGAVRLNACLHDMETLLLASPLDQNQISDQFRLVQTNIQSIAISQE